MDTHRVKPLKCHTYLVQWFSNFAAVEFLNKTKGYPGVPLKATDQNGAALNGEKTLNAKRRMLIESRFHPKHISSEEEKNWCTMPWNHIALGMSGQIHDLWVLYA